MGLLVCSRLDGPRNRGMVRLRRAARRKLRPAAAAADDRRSSACPSSGRNPSYRFDIFYAAAVAIFAAAWSLAAPHPWSRWSIWGSALIVFATYYQVQVSVAINNWYGPFYDLIQAALSKSKTVVTSQSSTGASPSFAGIACVAVVIAVSDQVICQSLYLPLADRDERLLHGPIGAPSGLSKAHLQRVQDDTMRFSSTMEGLGRKFHRCDHDLDRFCRFCCDCRQISLNCPSSANSLSAGSRRCLLGRCSAQHSWRS